jgi:hypothetical protein
MASVISSASFHDATGISRPSRAASGTRPGIPSGTIRSETQMLVSTTTRRPASPDLGHRRGYVVLDLVGLRLQAVGHLAAAVQQTAKAPLPFPLRDQANSLGGQPGVDGLSD